MADDMNGMEGSEHRIRMTARRAGSGALLAALVALAGCGGGGDKDAAAPPPPVNASPTGSGGLVTAEGTNGLVGPADRVEKGKTTVIGKEGKISPNANKKTPSQKGVGAGDQCENAGITPTQDNLGVANAAILCLLNAERQAAGLGPLAQNAQLDKASQVMADLMVQQVFFSHETPDGRNVVDRVEPTGYLPNSDDWVLGENLAWGSGALATPQAIVNGWMNSEGHKKNILASDYKDIGLGATMGSPSASQKGGTTYANAFGAKGSSGGGDTGSGDSGAGGGGGDDSATTASSGDTQKVASAKKKAKKKKKKSKKRKKRR